MVRAPEPELIEKMRTTPLAGLASSLGIDIDAWLPIASSPLPVTMRLTPRRHDIDWTREQLIAMGGKRIEWLSTIEAWQMPFPKGDIPDDAKAMLMILHETGRITRQEAVSMLPPVVLEPAKDSLVMDTCAAPGSKATQLAEAIPDGLVLANEPSSGRLNMLATNRGRLGLANMLIMQHDGRHIGRMPEPGIEGIVVDAPCTGTATTRKNRDLWWGWSPKDGRSMFQLQTDIAYRAAQLLVPGGLMVYSTCSIDPTENEAAVCEILRRCPWLELVNIDANRLFPGLVVHHGIDNWEILDEEANPIEWTGEIPRLPGLKEEMLNPLIRGEEAPPLSYTIRVHPHDNNTGGFYVALFRHIPEATPEGIAKSMILKRKLMREPVELPRQNPNRHTINPADSELVKTICDKWGIDASAFSWWHRGKRTNIASPMTLSRLYHPTVQNNKGDFWPGDAFHPLRIVHVGQPSFTDNKGFWRPRGEAMELLRPHITKNLVDVDEATLIGMLKGNVPLVEDFPVEIETGSSILRCGEHLAPVWVAARVSFMVSEKERDVLRLKLGVEVGGEEE